jgi:hypothetical protein
MHPEMAGAFASQHRHEMTAKASHHTQATLGAQAGEAAEVCRAARPVPGGPAGRDTLPQAAASSRGPRRGLRRPHLPGALLPRYRVSWSRTALSTAAADGARRGHSWVIVISATRSL